MCLSKKPDIGAEALIRIEQTDENMYTMEVYGFPEGERYAFFGIQTFI